MAEFGIEISVCSLSQTGMALKPFKMVIFALNVHEVDSFRGYYSLY